MRVTTEELSDRQVRLTVEVEDGQAQEMLHDTARRLSRRLRIPGFRPGRAPYAVVLSAVGEERLKEEAFEAVGQKLYEDALTEAEIDAYAEGSLEEVQWDPLKFRVTVPLKPVIDLGDYKSLRVAREPILILDEDVDEALEGLRERFASWVPVDRPAEDGDMLIMDVHGTVEDEEIMDHENWERVLRTGESGSLPGFDAALEGMEAGQQRNFSLEYPADAPRWAGKTASFDVIVHAVKNRELPPLDDELAAMAGQHETLTELREAMRQQIRAQREREADYEGQVLDALVEQGNIQVPPIMVERELEALLQDHDHFFRQRGMPLQDYLRVSGKPAEEYREEQRPYAERRLKRNLAIAKLIQDESLSVDEADIAAELEARVSRQSSESSAKLREMLESASGRRMLRSDLLSRRGMLRLMSIASGEPEPAESDAVTTEQIDDAAEDHPED